MSSYDETYARSLAEPEAFWAEAAEDIEWTRKWDKVFDDSRPPFYRWFVGGELNTAQNCLDRHVAAGRGDQPALIYDSPVTGKIQTFTYRELTDLVARFAGALAAEGVGKGDRVLIYMPMVPEAAVAMLACARLGAVHSVVFGGFAPQELVTRIDDCAPKVIVSASCGIEVNRVIAYKPLLDEAVQMAAKKPARCIILQRAQATADMVEGRDLDWAEAMAAAAPHDCVPVRSDDPLYIIYTSGTTGQPKGVVRDNGGHAVALKWSMRNVYGVQPGEVFWAASDVGWVVGHSYIVYGPLLHGATAVLFEGKPVGTPDAGVYWRVISQHGVCAMFSAPTAFRAIKKEDPQGQLIGDYDLSRFRTLFLAGERGDPDTIQWAERHVKVPVIDHWWQTESGWPMAANCVGLGSLPVKYGSPTKPVPGWKIRVLDDSKAELGPDQTGAICVELPTPPGMLLTLWNNDDRFLDSYMADFPGYYHTADAGHLDSDGYLYVMSRTDDIINVAGHRLSTGAMEEVLAAHPDVAECAVVGVADPMKGQVPLGLLVLQAGVDRSEADISGEAVRMVRERIGAVAAFKTAIIVQRLPKTRSGKIVRGTIQKMADDQPYKVPATIEDPAVIGEIAEALRTVGYPKPAGA